MRTLSLPDALIRPSHRSAAATFDFDKAKHILAPWSCDNIDFSKPARKIAPDNFISGKLEMLCCKLFAPAPRLHARAGAFYIRLAHSLR
jgi:hypothetical protein